MTGRTIAIGDIHGCVDALSAVLDAVRPCADDTLVTLGDYIDRGPNSCGVLDRLLNLADCCCLIPLLGDHEELLLEALSDETTAARWLRNGGAETLRSYGWRAGGSRHALSDWVPNQHKEFLAGCKLFYETQSHFFVHAGFQPELPLAQQPRKALLWRVSHAGTTAAHCSGKVAVVGHTPQRRGEVLDLGFLLCIDTNCVRGGWLTAIDVETGKTWQADCAGSLRNKVANPSTKVTPGLTNRST